MKKTNCLTGGALLSGRLCLFFCWSLAIAWMLMPQKLVAQQKGGKTISGTVYNQEGAPLAGASISVKGEKAARTTTDLNGNFTISVPPATTTLVISFVGATPKEVSVVNQTAVTANKRMLSVTGKSPLEFIRDMRMQKAAMLLEKTNMTISEVAYEVGFNNPKNFSKSFKATFQVLPSAYRLQKQ